jgi:hypothetical protein
VARKEEVGRRFEVWFEGVVLDATAAAMEVLLLGEARWFSGSSPTLPYLPCRVGRNLALYQARGGAAGLIFSWSSLPK